MARGSWAEEVVDRLLEVRQNLGRSVSLGISGVDCAGKSTLAAAVEELLKGREVPSVLISGDEFTRPTTERHGETDEGLGYYLNSFDYTDLFDRILPAVRSDFDGELLVQVSDWERDSWRARRIVVPLNAAVIVEGCFLFAGKQADAFDLTVWIDLPLAQVVHRALRRPRDIERMGGPSGVRERYATRYLPGQAIHIERDRPAAHATLVLAY